MSTRSRARGGGGGGGARSAATASLKYSQPRRVVRTLIVLCLCLIAIVPPILFHLRITRFQRINCGWLTHPPLVCAHGGDSSTATPNTVSNNTIQYTLVRFLFSVFTPILSIHSLSCSFVPDSQMAAYVSALRSQVDCIEIDVSRSSDGVLFALHDRDLQRLSGNTSSKVGHYSSTQLRELSASLQSVDKSNDQSIPTIQDALTLTANSVRQIILDIKVGPPFYEKRLARDILSIVEETECQNCVIWCKSDNLVRDVIKLSSEITVGYIVMIEPSTRARTNLLRMKGAEVVGVYHQLIDEKLMRVLHRRNKKVYAWTVDDMESMQRMLFEHVDAIITGNPTLLQRLMHDTRTQCLEEGYSLPN